MSQAVLKIRKKPVPFIIEKVRLVVRKMLLNINYLNPNPSLLSVADQVNRLEAAFVAAIKKGVDNTARVRTERKKMLAMMFQLTAYVQNKSGGNETKIRSAGYEVKSKRSPVGLLPPPANVRTKYGSRAGEVLVQWNGVPRRTCYKVQISEEPENEDSWTDIPSSETGKRRLLVSGLMPGKVYWFRVITHSTAGFSGPSDVSNHRAA